MIRDVVERREDMSSTGRLRLVRQDDGDIGIVVIDEQGRIADIEFCIPGSGGGHSPNTHRALRHLFDAMERDNAGLPLVENERIARDRLFLGEIADSTTLFKTDSEDRDEK